MENIKDNLQKIGFTENEARVYIALLEKPDSTGYEASRISGVPRAKVYEVLASMERKGLIMVSEEEERQTYQPLSPEVLLGSQKKEMEKVLTSLERDLRKLEKKEEKESLVSIQGRGKILEIARNMIRRSEVRIFASGFPEELQNLGDEFQAAEKRGARSFIMNFGEFEWPKLKIFPHPVSPLLLLRIITNGRWLTLVIDNREALIAQLKTPEKSRALWTKNPAVIQTAGGWITNDLSFHFILDRLNEVIEKAPEETKTDISNLRREAIEFWRSMWTLDESEVDKTIEKVKEFNPGEFLQRIEKVSREKTFSSSGVIQIDLTGKSGGSWQLNFSPGGLIIRESQDYEPDLTLEMESRDFQGLLEGNLQYNALMPRGRVKLKGDLSYVPILSEFLG